ncbi:hypothetical protein [Actinomycetospora sp. TBRC 11914]|uniref:hypothetical protein n=1 Tax=Actinomycetospora sp. TBRC 11914 TaxID=2729387 RepID=UPI00145CEC80|nr:hypothetical protein [Actinomycetospora sp. TBRC 11914]NMO92352.1 hypothetical protein [Actinomycetospora sp. TBRC 11914]
MTGARGGRLAALTRPAVTVPIALVVLLAVLGAAAAVLADRASGTARDALGDTGPALAGVALPDDGSAGSPTVVESPSAATSPRAAEIRDLVQRQVDARNNGDYGAWVATSSATSSASVSSAQFADRNRTVKVGSVILRRIDPVGDGEYVVPMGMITTQDPAAAPPDVRVPRLCWQVSMSVVTERGTLRLVDPSAGSSLRTPC